MNAQGVRDSVVRYELMSAEEQAKHASAIIWGIFKNYRPTGAAAEFVAGLVVRGMKPQEEPLAPYEGIFPGFLASLPPAVCKRHARLLFSRFKVIERSIVVGKTFERFAEANNTAVENALAEYFE